MDIYKLELDGLERLILEMCIDGYFDSSSINSLEMNKESDPTYFEEIVNVYGKKNFILFQKLLKHIHDDKFKDDEEFKEIYNDFYNDYDMRMYILLNYNYVEVLDKIKEKLKLKIYE